MSIDIRIVFLSLLLLNFSVGFSAPRSDIKQIAFDHIINWLDTAQIDRKGSIVKFDKDEHKIYFVDAAPVYDQLYFQCCNINKPGFIVIDSSFHKKIDSGGKFKSEDNNSVIKLRRGYIKRSSYEDFKQTHTYGDIYMVMCGTITVGLNLYVHISFGFGDWIWHDYFIKLDNEGNVIDYVICTGVE